MTKDVWPDFISCVLAVREDAITTRRADVQSLVDGIARSGMWIDQDKDGEMKHRMQAADIAAQRQYYNHHHSLSPQPSVLYPPNNRSPFPPPITSCTLRRNNLS